MNPDDYAEYPRDFAQPEPRRSYDPLVGPGEVDPLALHCELRGRQDTEFSLGPGSCLAARNALYLKTAACIDVAASPPATTMLQATPATGSGRGCVRRCRTTDRTPA